MEVLHQKYSKGAGVAGWPVPSTRHDSLLHGNSQAPDNKKGVQAAELERLQKAGHLVEGEAELILDHLGARHDGNVLQVAALALAKARRLYRNHLPAGIRQSKPLLQHDFKYWQSLALQKKPSANHLQQL